jgi:hypothetical protein
MDNELLNSLIETVVNDIDRVNDYKGFDQLLLTLSNDEIIYFMEECKENLFLNVKLGYLLVDTIPVLLKEHVIDYTDRLLDGYDQSLIEVSNGDPEYDSKTNRLILGKTKVERFRKIYLDEINNKLKNN